MQVNILYVSQQIDLSASLPCFSIKRNAPLHDIRSAVEEESKDEGDWKTDCNA